jgi:hypothetical protein
MMKLMILFTSTLLFFVHTQVVVQQGSMLESLQQIPIKYIAAIDSKAEMHTKTTFLKHLKP